ncbi:MAG: hypothetical protein QXI27_05725 [Nitrososphaerota archaeon]
MKHFEKTLLDEGESCCDVCGRVDKTEKFTSVYFGVKGQKIDLCSRCLKEGRVNAKRK